MDKNLEQTLAALATKLGTTVESLYAAMIKQAFWDSLTKTGLLIGIMMTCVLIASYTKRKLDSKDKDGDPVLSGIPREMVIVGICAFGFLFGLALIIQVYIDLPSVLAGFFNPEYWALSKILKFK